MDPEHEHIPSHTAYLPGLGKGSCWKIPRKLGKLPKAPRVGRKHGGGFLLGTLFVSFRELLVKEKPLDPKKINWEH